MSQQSRARADRASIRKRKSLRRRTFLTFVLILTLLALRLRPFEYAKLLRHGSTIKPSAVQDKKQCLERPGSEFALRTVSFRAKPIVRDFALPITDIVPEARPSTGAYYNRPPPLA
jgi:hypothetical protein